MPNRSSENNKAAQDFLKKVERLAKNHQSKKKSDMDTEKSPKRRAISKNIKNFVWKKYIGNSFEGKCFVCGNTITVVSFDLAHVIAVANGGGDDIDNLRPLCRECNGSIATENLEEFKQRHFGAKEKGRSKEIRDGSVKTIIQNEKPISKRELLNKFSREKLIKIAEKLDVCSEMERFVYEKEGYVDILSGSRKVTVEKIKKILGT